MNIEDRVNQLREFFDRHTSGVIEGTRPHSPCVFLKDEDLINGLASSRNFRNQLETGKEDELLGVNSNFSQYSDFILDFLDIVKVNSIDDDLTPKEVMPDAFLVAGIGTGKEFLKAISKFDSNYDRLIPIFGIDSNIDKAIIANDIIGERGNIYCSEITSTGNVRSLGSESLGIPSYSSNVLNGYNSVALHAARQCGDLAFSSLNLGLNSNVSYFIASQCCYEKSNNRDSKSKLGRSLNFSDLSYRNASQISNMELPECNSEFDSEPSSHFYRRRSNMPINALIRLGLHLDLAAFMQENGYEVGVKYNDGLSQLHGLKR